MTMKKLSQNMIDTLEYFARKGTGEDMRQVLCPGTTAQFAALVQRGLITPGAPYWNQQITDAGRAVAGEMWPTYKDHREPR